MTHSPNDLARLYTEEVWNKGNAELIRQICADPMIRHEAGKRMELSHDQQVERVRQTVATNAPHFENQFVVTDADHVVLVWNMDTSSEKIPKMAGIEVFRVRDGRLTECWNHPHAIGHWG